MNASEMKRIERTLKCLMEHMDEYTYEEFSEAGQNLLDAASENIFDDYYNNCLLEHIRNLYSLYRFTKLGEYK